MSLKNSLAQKKRWSKIPKKKRSEMMREKIMIRQKKMTKMDRLAEGKRLAIARVNKKKVV